MPFSVVHSDGDSQSEGEGLSGQPAFSSVLTVMAGTVKHPVSLDQSRTLPTITRDETHTTQWPSHSSSHGSEMSSSASSAGDRILPASSGLASNMSHQPTTPPQAVIMASTVSRPSHVLFVDGNRIVSSFSSVSSSSLSSMSPSALSTSSALSAVVSPFSLPSSAGWINKAASPSQSQRIVSSLAPQKKTVMLSPAGSLDWIDSLTAPQSSTQSVVARTAITEAMRSTTNKPHFSSETSIEKSNEVTKLSLHSPVDKIHAVSGTYIKSESTNVIKAPATSTYTSYSTPNRGHNFLKILYRPTQTQNLGMNSVSSNNLEISTSFPTNQEETQAVQRQQGALQNPTSALPSAHPKGYSLSSHVTQQMSNETAYADSQTLVHKGAGDAITSPVNSHVVNPTASPAVMLRTTTSFFTPPGKMSFSETAITKLTPLHSGTVSSEQVSNPGDLLMAAGHGSPRVPAININYNQGETVESELKSISAHTHLNNILSLTQPRSESTTGSILSSITRTDTTSSTSESDSPHLLSNGVVNVQESPTQTGSTKGLVHEPTGWSMTTMIFSSNSRTMSLSDSALPVRLAKDITYKTMYESLSHHTRPTFVLPLFVSHSPNHNNTDNNTGLSANSEVNFADQVKASLSSEITPSQRPLQTGSLLTFPHNTTSGLTAPLSKSRQTVSSAEISAHSTKSEISGQSKPLTFKVETTAGNSETLPSFDVHVTYEKIHRNAEKISVSTLFDVSEESTLIRDTAFNKKGVPSGQFTTQFPSFVTTKDFFVLNKVSEGSGKGSSSVTPFSPVPFDAALETLSRKDDVTLMGNYEQSSPSSWSEIIRKQRTNTISRSPGLITSVRSNKSINFYFGTQTTIPSTASSAVTTSTIDGQKSSETFKAILSVGTKIMAQHTKWKATKPVSFKSTASELENTSTGFDRANSNSRADGPSYTRPKLEGEQEHNAHVLNSTDPAVVASDPHSLYPTVGEHPSFTYVKGTSEDREQSLNLSPANLRSVAVSVQQGGTVNTAAPSAQGSDAFLRLSHITTDSVTSSQASSLALVYESKHGPPLAEADYLDKTALNFSDTDNINMTTDSKPRRLTLPSSSFHSSPSSSETSPLSYSSVKASHLKPTTSVSAKALSASLSSSSSTLHSGTIVSVKPTMYPAGTASSSLSVQAVPAMSSSTSPSLNVLIDTEKVTKTSVVLTEMGKDDLTAGTSKAVALTSPKEKVDSLAPSQSVRITLSAGPTERTSQVSLLPPRQDTTTASVKLTTTTLASTTKTENPTTATSSLRTTQSTTTPHPTPFTRRTTATTTIRTHTSRKIFTPPVPRTSPPRGATAIFVSPFTTTTEAPPQQCNITERLWVKTGKQYFCHSLEKKVKCYYFSNMFCLVSVLVSSSFLSVCFSVSISLLVVSIYVRRNRLDSIQRQNLRRGLSQGLRKALNDSSAQAQVRLLSVTVD